MERDGLAIYLVGIIGLICLMTLSSYATSAEVNTTPPGNGSETQPAEPGPTSAEGRSPQPAGVETSSIQDRWGIEIIRIRLSAAGNMLDFRYRVIEPDKAHPILDFKVKPYLIDQKSGAKFQVPNPPKVGSLRQTSRSGRPQANRIYFILFSNPGRSVQVGDKVTVVVGDFRAEDLIVQ